MVTRTPTRLLAVDVGNTNTVLGVFRGDDLAASWRIQTVAARTADEYAVLVRSLLELEGFAWGTIGAGIIAPASNRSRTAGSKSFGRCRRRSRCSDAPSVVEMT